MGSNDGSGTPDCTSSRTGESLGEDSGEVETVFASVDAYDSLGLSRN